MLFLSFVNLFTVYFYFLSYFINYTNEILVNIQVENHCIFSKKWNWYFRITPTFPWFFFNFHAILFHQNVTSVSVWRANKTSSSIDLRRGQSFLGIFSFILAFFETIMRLCLVKMSLVWVFGGPTKHHHHWISVETSFPVLFGLKWMVLAMHIEGICLWQPSRPL